MKISPYIIYLEMQPNALLLRQNFDSQKVSVTPTSMTTPTGMTPATRATRRRRTTLETTIRRSFKRLCLGCVLL
jgi:hypothetical protein